MDLQSLITLDKQAILTKLNSSLDGLTHLEVQKGKRYLDLMKLPNVLIVSLF